VAQAVTVADMRGWGRAVAVQAPYSLADRSVEREVLPMAEAMELAVIAWGLLEGGVLTGKYNTDTDEARRYGSDAQSDRELKLALELKAVADELGRSAAQVAINWIRQQPWSIIPILGARTEVQLKDNMACLDFELTPEQLERLSQAGPSSSGSPGASSNRTAFGS
jgi:aryl-alcohol dehydrogenase-like predicted oxidoreductase